MALILMSADPPKLAAVVAGNVQAHMAVFPTMGIWLYLWQKQ
jgi:hypothetical protein